MSYQKYGIRPQLVERVKFKLKNPVVKDRMRLLLGNVTKYDLQDRVKVRKLVKSATSILQEPLTDIQEEQIIDFVLGQKIDPNNTFHLLKLWGMFR
ncbi:stage VI sporulation protein F [Paenibacillus glycanilyticus]|uniref:stage VI sporulation protein F n=1 Tax=Paenibacillus TaxID=44249 RepID=UPI00030234BF|nr:MULTISPECIES: stage VI sporulation protein F [Paenibacillus]MCM3626297.1 stage VI sporulation protein F [Paenibacillus glycanilyticus]